MAVGRNKPPGPAFGRPDDKLRALRRSGAKGGRRLDRGRLRRARLRCGGAMRYAYCALRALIELPSPTRPVAAMCDGTRPTKSGERRMGRRDGSDPSPIISISRGCLKIKVYTCTDQRQNEFRVITPNDS